MILSGELDGCNIIYAFDFSILLLKWSASLLLNYSVIFRLIDDDVIMNNYANGESKPHRRIPSNRSIQIVKTVSAATIAVMALAIIMLVPITNPLLTAFADNSNR